MFDSIANAVLVGGLNWEVISIKITVYRFVVGPEL